MVFNLQTPKSRNMAERNRQLRESLWHESRDEVWNRKTNKGWTTIPRVLPLILHLITIMDKPKRTGVGNPSRVYLDLWCRVFDEGFVEVADEEDFAYSAGYGGDRAVRTWKAHVKMLIDLGFVKAARKGNRDLGYLLIIDPYLVAERLHKEGRVPEHWWNAFLARVHKTGAMLPSRKKNKIEIPQKAKTKAKKRKPPEKKAKESASTSSK